ncbi:MAG: RnfABCDGE type electron transport complex subunit D [Oscillospiraceae bacterium]|nr:RnfABCDGE type electron transport complex subunit D [Oscillospiraceae bacterium]
MTSLQRKKHDKSMLWAIFALVLCGSVLHGARVWLLCLIAVVTAKAVDVLVSMIRRCDYDSTDHSSEVAALIFTLMLPVNIPIYIIVVSVGLAIAVGKHMFGGKDVYPFNLAALTMCCAAVNWPGQVFSAVTPFAKVDLLSGYTTQATLSNASLIKDGGVPPYGVVDMLMGNYPGVMGADFVIVIVAIGIIMILRRKITWHIPVTFLVTCSAIAFAFPRVYGFSRLESVQFEMLNGSVFFVALFMLADPVTTPKTPKAKIVFGFITAVLGMVFRYVGSFDIGTCFALLLVNTMDGYIERMVGGKKIKVKQIEDAEEKTEDKKSSQRRIYTADKTETPKPHRERIRGASDAMDLISETEDNIDNVIYSTRTISIDEILKAEAEQKKKRGGKK